MSPILSSEAVRLVHDSMIRDQLDRQRHIRTPNILRHGMAVLLITLGGRLDPSVRRPTLPAAPASGQRLRPA